MLFLSILSAAIANPESPYQVSVEAKMIPLIRLNPDFDSATEDSTWITQQNIRLITQGEWNGIILKGSLQDARLWGRESSPVTSSDALAGLHEGYVQMGAKDNRSFYVRAGRQEYKMYDGMLMWDRSWNLYNIAFNGIRAHYEQQFASVDVAAFVLNGSGTYTTICEADDDDCTPEDKSYMGDFMLLTETDFNLSTKLHLQPYYLSMHQGPNDITPDRSRNIFSPGLRLAGKLTPDLNYVLDHTQQFGFDGDREHRAWRAQATFTYKWDIFAATLHYDERSGDGDATDELSNDFEPFFGAGHKFRGFGDYVGLSNVRDLSARFKSTLSPYFSILVDYHHLQLSNNTGNWFTLGGTRGLGTGDDGTLGQEFDLVLDVTPFKKTSLKIGHALFLPTGEGTILGGEDWSSSTYVWMHVTR
jgi:hypothetical protein